MRSILLILFICILSACSNTKLQCVEDTCVHTDQAVTIDDQTQKMYRDIGYRVPVYIPPLQYPKELYLRGLEATLVVMADIDEKGYVVSATVKSSTVENIFDEYAIEYVKGFVFEPSKELTKGQLQRVTYSLK